MALLRGADDELPPRYAALARFAVAVTDEPWSLRPELIDGMREQGFEDKHIEAAAGVVAMFNYLNCVADATGIEFDYESPLPVFEVDHDRPAVVRPGPDSWPVVPAEFRGFGRLPALDNRWREWREYVFESDEPLQHRERQLLARAAAEESCDRWRADELRDYEPKNDAETRLVEFGHKLSRNPWRLQPADLDALRDAGYAERALLHAIAVVGLQHGDSRLAMARALLG